MARLLVRDAEQGTESPFLRGILTRSLQESGLSFEQAYELASAVREQLLDDLPGRGDQNATGTVSSRKLQARVIKALRKAGHAGALERYRGRRVQSEPVTVVRRDGTVTPFVRGYHQRGLQSCGLSADEAAVTTGQVYEQLVGGGAGRVTPVAIDRITYATLGRELGEAVARRYLVWRDFLHSGRPLVLLIGGTAGCGKSTIATGIANRLEIVRTQSTDMLREVMRVMMPERLLPVLHRSSFNAWEEIPQGHLAPADFEARIAAGYLAQAELLSVACEAVVQRAVRERVSLILEGVHINPTLIEHLRADGDALADDALIVPVMLAVLNAKTLRDRIRGRGSKVPGRRSKRYLQAFDGIWALQSYLLSEADRSSLAIIRNDDEEKVFLAIMRLVLDRLEEAFTGSADQVFSEERTRQRGLPS